MSTKKNDKKPVTKATAKVEPKKPETITLSDEVIENERVYGGKLTLVGRGDAVHAALALKQVWFAWSSSFGIESAFRIVRVELDANDKNWYALVVPVTEVLG